MKKLFLVSFCIIIVKASFAFEPISSNENKRSTLTFKENKQLLHTPNYQQFKTQVLNLEIKETLNL